MKQLLFAGVSLIVASMIAVRVPSSALAAGAYGQYGQYGGSVTPGKVIVDKTVRNPKTGVYVDNLGLVDAKYVADNAVYFKITVQNTGGSALEHVTVTDYLPPFVKYVSGGKYNSATRQVTFSFDNVAPNEARSTVIQVQVVSLKELPEGKGIICPVNKVVATASVDGVDEDVAQFCIEKKVMAEKVPQTGDPVGLLFGLGSIPALLAGIKLRKRV